MRKIVQIEFSKTLLDERIATLKEGGFDVIGGVGCVESTSLSLPDDVVIVVGHGAPFRERQNLISRIRRHLPNCRLFALLRRSDPFPIDVDAVCPADDPVLWMRTVQQLASKFDTLN